MTVLVLLQQYYFYSDSRADEMGRDEMTTIPMHERMTIIIFIHTNDIDIMMFVDELINYVIHK